VTEEIRGAGIVRSLWGLGGTGHQLATHFLGRDLDGNAIGHLGEGAETDRRHGQNGRAGRDHPAHADARLEHALNDNVFAENVRNRIAVFRLSETAQPHDLLVACGRPDGQARRGANQKSNNSQYDLFAHTTSQATFRAGFMMAGLVREIKSLKRARHKL
jgi:hypothetical protein